MLFKFISLKNKLLLIQMAIGFITITLVAVYFSFNEYKSLKESFIKDVNIYSRILADFLAAPLSFSDTLEVNKTISKMKPAKDICLITVYDSEKSILAKYNTGTHKHETNPFKMEKSKQNFDYEDEDHFIKITPIYHQDLLLGYLEISATKNNYYDKFYNYASNILILFVILSVIIFFISNKFQLIISKPVKRLTDYIKKMNFNEIDTFTPIGEIKYNDEFKLLFESYNYMAIRIKNDFSEICKSKKAIEEISELKSIILRNMTHELRTPLNGIIGNAAFLLMADLEQDDKESVELIYTSSKRLLITIESLLSISQIDSKELEMALSPYKMGEFIEEYFSKIDSMLKKDGVEIFYSIKDFNIKASIDTYYFKQAIYQLLDNAIKFTKKGKVNVEISSEVTDSQNYCLIKVSDTGIGIPEDKFEEIFGLFKQQSMGLNRSYEGMGIGLSLARRIIELHNGTIKVESELEIGSIFTIQLPGL